MTDNERNALIKTKGYKFETDKEESFYIKGINDCEEFYSNSQKNELVIPDVSGSLSLCELKDVLCHVSQLIAGWNATEAEWSKWDQEVKEEVYQLQLKLEGKEAANFR